MEQEERCTRDDHRSPTLDREVCAMVASGNISGYNTCPRHAIVGWEVMVTADEVPASLR